MNLNNKQDSRLFVIAGKTREEITKKSKELKDSLSSGQINLLSIAQRLESSFKRGEEHLSIVASSVEELRKKLDYALEKMNKPDCGRIHERSGIYYFDKKLMETGKTAFIFPGEGAQYEYMLAELCLNFPEVRRSFEIVDSACSAEDGFIPSSLIFPPPMGKLKSGEELWKMEGAVEAVLSADNGIMALLKKFKIKPDVVLGHSSGEFPALEAAGVIRFKDDKERIKFIREGYVLMKALSSQKDIPESILATIGGVELKELKAVINEVPSQIFIAMENCPNQYVICGLNEAIEKAVEILTKKGAICGILPFKRPYHTPWFKPALKLLKDFFRKQKIYPPEIKIYSCSSVKPYPDDAGEIRQIAVQQWEMPVKFQETIEKMYDEGVRIFIEVGPRGNLTAFVENILKGKTHVAVALDKTYRSGIEQLNHALGLLIANGVKMDLDYLYRNRFHAIDLSTNEGKEQGFLLSAKLPEMGVEDEYKSKLRFSVSEKHPEIKTTKVEKDTFRKAMDIYFRTMEDFISSQTEIVQSYLKGKSLESRAIKKTNLKSKKFPLLGKILELKEEESLISIREFDIDEDIFLQHHTLGTQISINDPELKALPLIPLTISTEILAEAASALFPKKVLVAMKDIRAYKWITFEEGKAVLQINARCNSSLSDSEEVNVQISQVINNDSRGGVKTPLSRVVEGKMILADAYPSAPKANSFSLRNEFRCNLSASEVYPKRLFHDRIFQAIDSVNLWGEDGLGGLLKASPFTGLFRSEPNPEFVTDPVLLDAMGQVIGVWAAKEPWNGFILFPFRVKSINFYRPNLSGEEKVKFQLRILSASEEIVISNIDLVGENGDIIVRIEGWEDRNFYITKKLHGFFLEPLKNILSSPWNLPEEKLKGKGNFKVCILEGFPDDFFNRHHKIWEKMLAFLIFNAKERNRWKSMQGNEKSSIQYLLGRAAAKDVVRLYLEQYHGLKLGAADIIIENDENGKPFVAGPWVDKVSGAPSISISHTGMVAVALAGKAPEGNVGIDVENIENLNEEVLEAAFSTEERRLASSSAGLNTLECMLKFWCSKEAFSKAMGSGIKFNLKEIIVKGFDVETGKVTMELNGKWLEKFPFLKGKKIEAYAFMRENLAVAICVC